MRLRASVGKRHLVIPDTQCRPGVSLEHATWLGRYVAHQFLEGKGFDVIVHLGDLWDMPSLSSYDTAARKAYDRRSYLSDKQSGDEWLKRFHSELEVVKDSLLLDDCAFHLTTGNHENRANIAVEKDPSLAEHISTDDVTGYASLLGWRVHPFLKPVTIDGIAFCHFFPLNADGGVSNSRDGAPSAKAQAQRARMSCTAGHKQGFDYAPLQGQKPCHGLIAGSFYLHDEKYKTPQGNHHWRGVVVKNDVRQGDYEICPVSMHYLYRRYRKPL